MARTPKYVSDPKTFNTEFGRIVKLRDELKKAKEEAEVLIGQLGESTNLPEEVKTNIENLKSELTTLQASYTTTSTYINEIKAYKDSFDMKKSHARMIMLGMNPPSPSKILDTLTVARKYFKFTSNHLDDLGDYLGVGNKLETGGKGLWKACMEGDAKAWKKMARYNKQDVVLLEEIYLKLRPWVDNHPAMNLMDGRPESCPKCGGGPLAKAGTKLYAKIGYRQRYQCTSCGGWSTGRPIIKDNNIKYTN